MRGEDRLSNLPLSVIETILCLVPIQEAGRTSILSKEWRYRWTKIPKLLFEEKTFQLSTVDGAESSILEQKHLEPNERKKMDTKSKLIYVVGQVLLMHDGPIHEFTLSFLISNQRVKIDHILTHLSRKTSIKKLKLDFAYAGYMLPSSIFSFHQLTDLCLIGCRFDHQPTIYGFGSLITSLNLRDVSISASTLRQILSSCPLLKTVFMNIPGSYISRSNGSLTFTELFELFECLPVIETLYLSLDLIDVFEDRVEGRVPKELPTPLFHLKYLSICYVFFTHKEELILALLINSSPNLEKLEVGIFDDGLVYESSMESSSRVNCYPGIMLEHLNELEINDFVNHKTRLDFVKLILARSPVLKTVRIFPHCNYRDKTLQISEILSGYSRASPEVQIIVEDPWS
ncbi:F-box/FBD/LRR-repeat protein-like protein [Tanacetum coccineum]|uniref:F-box/FBD/LRR-repeat protein-like protein n=1 Tax=Tanacetum coccineum TaxID=301880 RepID=A0ABQ4X509_9ASTR